MEKFNLKRAEQLLIYKAIAGSKAYGLDLPTSDTDIRGIFLQPNEYRLGNGYCEQVADKKNDIVYYEVNRFVNLLANNNPNIIENLFVTKDKILHFDKRIKPLYDNREKFLTKKIRFTFGGYAISQIKKARGLNKKIVNPVEKERKTPLDFCYAIANDGYSTIPMKKYLKANGLKQEYCGLTNMPHMKDVYAMFYDWKAHYAESGTHGEKELGFKGIMQCKEANDISLSSIPKYMKPEATISFNKDGYSSYCKDYKEYWNWVKERNPHRYNDNTSHGQNLDGKNMMHCLRMLDMAIEIAEGKGVNLIRPNREWLLGVRKGEVSYDEIMDLIDQKKEQMDNAFDMSDLPEKIDADMVHNIILQIRKI